MKRFVSFVRAGEDVALIGSVAALGYNNVCVRNYLVFDENQTVCICRWDSIFDQHVGPVKGRQTRHSSWYSIVLSSRERERERDCPPPPPPPQVLCLCANYLYWLSICVPTAGEFPRWSGSAVVPDSTKVRDRLAPLETFFVLIVAGTV
jgi:hypothetical protein